MRIPYAIRGLHQRSIGQIHWRTSCSGGHCATPRIALVHDVRSACNCLSSTTCLRQLTLARVKPPYTTVQCGARSMPSVAREVIRSRYDCTVTVFCVRFEMERLRFVPSCICMSWSIQPPVYVLHSAGTTQMEPETVDI